jgi:hypothetical protein
VFDVFVVGKGANVIVLLLQQKVLSVVIVKADLCTFKSTGTIEVRLTDDTINFPKYYYRSQT